jgi:signal transduction histidine kinase
MATVGQLKYGFKIHSGVCLSNLPTAIENALTPTQERANRRRIALHQALDQRLGPIRRDERKIKQVLLNLLSNALKFTQEGGRIPAATLRS